MKWRITMKLTPFGVMNNDYRSYLEGLYTPMADWPHGRAEYGRLLDDWLNKVRDHLWPVWDGRGWSGDAAKDMEANTRDELTIAVRLYHGHGDALDIISDLPHAPTAADGKMRDHNWHYKIEDALVLDPQFLYVKLQPGETVSYEFRSSRGIGSNYLVYDPGIDIERFEGLFWGRMRRIQPKIWDIKQHFQRPRPWATAAALQVDGFRWIVAGGDFVTHTGIHPSILSGHCIQGVLAGCNVYDAWLADGQPPPQRIEALQHYMVDWGDRRVFAGVHYMTDNIASWTLARKLIPHLFKHPAAVEEFAVTAITEKSRVFQDILGEFKNDSPAVKMLMDYFPEGARQPASA
jgi:hypothetical protein